MAVTDEKKLPWGALRGPQLLVLYLIGLVAVYVGERLIGGRATAHWMVDAAGALLVLLSCGLWMKTWLQSGEQPRKVERLAALLALGGLFALVVYLLGSELVWGPVPVTRTAKESPGLREVLGVAWPIILACTVLPLTFLQWSAASMTGGKGVECDRVYASARAGAMSAILLCTLFLVNAIADRKDIHVDLSYFKTTSPSDASRTLAEGLDADTQAFLFFPAANEVLEEILPYFQELDRLSDKFQVVVVDRALEPELAKKHQASKDGTVVLARGESRQTISLDTELDRATRKLRTLDAEFQKALLKLNRERRVVYLITGHGERGAGQVEGDVRPRISVLKEFLVANNLTVKQLGAVEGLANQVPDDAALVIWIDPAASLFPGESEALRVYLERGGRMLITLDPDSQARIDDFLEFLGLVFSPAKLAHDRIFVPLSRTPADQYNLVTDAFSSHPSVTLVSRYSRQMPVLLPSTGSLDKLPQTNRKVTFIVRSQPNTWADADRDLTRGKEEKLGTFNLAAVVSEKVTKEAKSQKEEKSQEGKPGQEQSKKEKPGKEKKPGEETKIKSQPPGKPEAKEKGKEPTKSSEDEMRVVVFADTDVFADDFIGFRIGLGGRPGSFQLLADVLTWLVEEGKIGGLPASEEDVKIAHTRNEDMIWFYATVFAVPLLILGVGVTTRWGRGQRRRVGR